MLVNWDELPEKMKNDSVREYYKVLEQKRVSLMVKRGFDIIVSFLLLVLLSPLFLILSVAIKMDSSGPVFFRQVRVTQYGKKFRIFKFRTMIEDAEKVGTQITLKNDERITRIGKVIRKYRLDEICQLIDILRGTMSFVGTRPEVPQYVDKYTDEMLATLLLPAGVTSKASILYKDEDRLLCKAENPDEVYIKKILPEKMEYNLDELKKFSLVNELKVMLLTVKVVLY